MSQLINMRQRIKAVETIKKITHAMRLIAMSNHSKLRQKKNYLENYKNEFQKLWLKIQNLSETHFLHQNNSDIEINKKLIILVGSQKGLCGNFNISLFKFFESVKINYNFSKFDFIAIGKQASSYLTQNKLNLILDFKDFNPNNFVFIAKEITNLIINNYKKYTEVLIFYNYPKSFFTQKPQESIIWPLTDNHHSKHNKTDAQNYIFEQPLEIIKRDIRNIMLTVTIQEILFSSLLAEQSARFLSMDNSTRNAENLLNTMKLDYNKLRQAKITLELTELASSY